MLGMAVPTAPSRAGMLKLGACQDEFPQIFLPTAPYGFSHLVRQQSSDKMQFAAISSSLTPPSHTERAAGSRDGWLYPKRAPLGVTLGVTSPLHSSDIPLPRATSPWGSLLVGRDLCKGLFTSFLLPGTKFIIFNSPLKPHPSFGEFL